MRPLCTLLGLMGLASAPASAEGPEAPQSYALQNTSPAFLTAEFVGSAFLGFMGPDLVLPPPPEVITCADAWCEPPGVDVWFNKLVALDQPRTAGHVSHVFTLGLTPGLAIAGSVLGARQAGKGSHAVADTVILIDSWMIATGFNSIAKATARRQRPAFYYGREDVTEADQHDDEEFLSFYSGDTTWAWSFAATGTTLAYLRGYRHAKWVAIGTGTLAFTGSFLRMSADMHWLSDVAVGTVAGAAVGAGVPLLLHRRKDAPPVSVGALNLRDGGGLLVRGSW